MAESLHDEFVAFDAAIRQNDRKLHQKWSQEWDVWRSAEVAGEWDTLHGGNHGLRCPFAPDSKNKRDISSF
jgi:hypothetical protein